MNFEYATPWQNPTDVVSIRQRAVRHGSESKKRIGILVYENCCFADIGLIVEIFDLANSAANRSSGMVFHYSISLLSCNGGRVQCSNFFNMETSPLDEPSSSRYFALFIAGGAGAATAAHNSRTTNWLKSVFQTMQVVQAAGSGTLLLENAGLPSTRGVITPTRTGDEQRKATSGNDLMFDVDAPPPLITALSIIRDDLDYRIAESIAERLLPFACCWLEQLPGESCNCNGASVIKKAKHWIDENFARPITVDDIAKSVSMGKRTFLRHFRAETGMPPSEYLLRTRLDIACRLLITTTLPIDKIARRCGMHSGTRLAKVFRRRLRICASDYRACPDRRLTCLQNEREN